MRRGAWIAVGLLVLVTLVALTAGRCGAGPPGPGAEARAPVVAPAATPQPAVVQAERTAAAGAATPAPADADAWSQRDDLDAFVRDEPDGTLGVVVLRGRHAVANARLRVWADQLEIGQVGIHDRDIGRIHSHPSPRTHCWVAVQVTAIEDEVVRKLRQRSLIAIPELNQC